MSPRRSQRQAILEAAFNIVEQESANALTIERVADAAGMSRGGVLYHFRSKRDLLVALVTTLNDGFAAALEHELMRDPRPDRPAPFTRAYARMLRTPDPQAGRRISGLLAALTEDRELLRPLHRSLHAWQKRTEQEVDATTAAIIRLCAHGLWTNGLLLDNQISASLRRAIATQLEGWVDQAWVKD